MTDADPTTPEPRGLSGRLRRPLWIGVATFLVVVVAVGLRIGVPIYGQLRALAAIREMTLRSPRHSTGAFLEFNNSTVTFSTPPGDVEGLEFREIGPSWLCDLLGEYATATFCSSLISVNLATCKVDSELE
jgi:hypothetical protein